MYNCINNMEQNKEFRNYLSNAPKNKKQVRLTYAPTDRTETGVLMEKIFGGVITLSFQQSILNIPHSYTKMVRSSPDHLPSRHDEWSWANLKLVWTTENSSAMFCPRETSMANCGTDVSGTCTSEAERNE